MKLLLTLLLLLTFVPALLPAAPSPRLSGVELVAFEQDLDLLTRELPARHARIDHHTPRAEFDAAAKTLRAQLPTLTRTAATVGLARLVALARDGHTALFLLPFLGIRKIDGFHPLPIQFYGFEDGWRVVAISRPHQDLLGARLKSIGGAPVAELETRLGALLPYDNAMGLREHLAWYLGLHQVLQAIGAADESRTVELQLDTGGSVRTVRLEALSGAADAGWMAQLLSLPLPRADWIAAGQAADTPLWLSQVDTPYWFKQTSADEIYAQINLLRETAPGDFAKFADRLLAAVPQSGNTRLILDLRLNRGGNGELAWPLIYALIRHPQINQRGRLYVMIGRRTFSAAQLLANALEKHTNAIFVGEPTGSSPNHYGELGQLLLPKTGLTVFYSQLYWQADPRDQRPWIAPDIAAPLTYSDLAAGRDPALLAIRTYQVPPSAPSLMDALLLAGKTEQALQAFRDHAARYPNPWARPFEKELNDYGYALLGKRPADALRVFTLATELYPNAANAWDSLGEANLAAGQRSRAAYCYARTLRLNPDDAHATDMLTQILGEPR